MAEIKYIEVTNLHPHPDNPRKDVGDISELAESIKANGVLQNLTVVPNMVTGEISGETWQRGYKVIIGHRRLAAAKLAGLTEVPCVVTEMTPQEQVATMLLENMQRSDLTVYEQAQGFQMMLNMGETVETVSQKTGFSQSTVRRRVKLLDLDPEEFRKSESRGATLQDYMELDAITDTALKNQVLQSIGTANFQQNLKSAKEKEKNKAYVDGVIAELESFASSIDEVDRETMEYIGNYGWWNRKAVQRPEDADTVQYYFRVSRDIDQVDLYRKRKAKIEVDPAEEERKRRADHASRRMDALEALTRQAYQLRADFIVGFTGSKKHASKIAVFAGQRLIAACDDYNTMLDRDMLRGLLNLDCKPEDDDINMDDYYQVMQEKPEYGLLCTAYAASDDDSNGYCCKEWNREIQAYIPVYGVNDDLDALYDFLISIGYEMSDMEKSLQDGSHPLFTEVDENA